MSLRVLRSCSSSFLLPAFSITDSFLQMLSLLKIIPVKRIFIYSVDKFFHVHRIRCQQVMGCIILCKSPCKSTVDHVIFIQILCTAYITGIVKLKLVHRRMLLFQLFKKFRHSPLTVCVCQNRFIINTFHTLLSHHK